MITKDKIDSFIEKIPPKPKVLKETLSLLNNGELTKAAKVAESDLALKAYLKNIVNKPIYGFKNEVSEISQIFGILGVSLSQQTVYNYIITLLSPAEWHLFKLNSKTFYELQANLSKKWELILKHLGIDDKDIYSAISLLPSSVIVAEALFCEKIEDVTLLRTTKSLDFNTILTRLCGIGLFDICEQIANKWEMGSLVPQILQASSGLKPSEDEKINLLGKWMHLLLFYELSQPVFIKAGLNDFVDFQIDYVEDIYEEFASVMGIE
ncbi:HDOD domain-containing protein [Candidatus Sulfurimonas baltica]|uniref:HDOD domain-containing protein n=1 Tax=Candidatus Sulfurimonas baltica TaxID=2740404 RepID=A0A7S7LW31_9BACT|nr:HDOD domain-containing protein [Candidatus Sulfurimonas baltica]QOY52531.1 HDOD domain-containing protein [Candidatus Sulfurimonas baltica]